MSSTYVWGLIAGRRDGRVYTVDPDAGALEALRSETIVFPCLEYVEAEPAEFLRRWPGEHPGEPIHLLYLESVETDGREAIDRRHVEEALAAAPALAHGGLVLFREAAGGDVAECEGEAGRAARFLSERGFWTLWAENRWVLLVFINPAS